MKHRHAGLVLDGSAPAALCDEFSGGADAAAEVCMGEVCRPPTSLRAYPKSQMPTAPERPSWLSEDTAAASSTDVSVAAQVDVALKGAAADSVKHGSRTLPSGVASDAVDTASVFDLSQVPQSKRKR